MLEYDDIYNDAWSRGDLVEWLIDLDKQICIDIEEFDKLNKKNDELRKKITALEDQIEAQRPKYPKIESFSMDIDYTKPMYNQVSVNEW